jgi:hypothetical protein
MVLERELHIRKKGNLADCNVSACPWLLLIEEIGIVVINGKSGWECLKLRNFLTIHRNTPVVQASEIAPLNTGLLFSSTVKETNESFSRFRTFGAALDPTNTATIYD